MSSVLLQCIARRDVASRPLCRSCLCFWSPHSFWVASELRRDVNGDTWAQSGESLTAREVWVCPAVICGLSVIACEADRE